MTPQELSLRGRMGALALHSRYDSRVVSAPGRQAFLSRFEREVDPDGTLPEAERQRRAKYAKRLYFTGLALRSVRSRRRHKEKTARATAQGQAAELAETAA